jgi:hypothetical protein
MGAVAVKCNQRGAADAVRPGLQSPHPAPQAYLLRRLPRLSLSSRWRRSPPRSRWLPRPSRSRSRLRLRLRPRLRSLLRLLLRPMLPQGPYPAAAQPRCGCAHGQAGIALCGCGNAHGHLLPRSLAMNLNACLNSAISHRRKITPEVVWSAVRTCMFGTTAAAYNNGFKRLQALSSELRHIVHSFAALITPIDLGHLN